MDGEVSLYDKPRPQITVDTVIPAPLPSDPGPSYSEEGYFKPRDTLNQEVVKSVEAVKRASSMQTPRQLLLTPQRDHSWPSERPDRAPKSPTIVISPPSEEHLPSMSINGSPLPKHRRSMAKAACVAIFVICTVVGLLMLFFFYS